MPPSPFRLIATLALGATLLVGACGGSAATRQPGGSEPSTSPAPGASGPSPSATPVPSVDKGPATGTFKLAGTLGLNGQFSASSISCNYPTPSGPQIIAFGQIGTNGPFVQVFVSPGSAFVRADMGSGTTFKMRTFVGSGVPQFDGASGAQINSPLKENTASNLSTTGIGVVSSISGKIDCGDQVPGTSTITVTGSTPQGPMTGPLTSAKVTCQIVSSGTAAGTYVDLVALTQIGSTTVTVNITTGAHQVTVFESSALGQASFADYTSSGATISGMSVHVSADIAQQTSGSPPPSTVFTVHVEGDATCGTIAHS